MVWFMCVWYGKKMKTIKNGNKCEHMEMWAIYLIKNKFTFYFYWLTMTTGLIIKATRSFCRILFYLFSIMNDDRNGRMMMNGVSALKLLLFESN